MTLSIGDRVKVVAPDPEYPENSELVGATGVITEDNPEAYGRLHFVVLLDDPEKYQCSSSLCFCAEELEKVKS